MMDYRKAYGLPDRYFLSLGRMVEKKDLSTLVEAYARFARASGERSKAETGNLKPELPETADGTAFTSAGTRHSSHVTRHTPVALVFVGSGELEGALKEQAQGLGLRVVDRTDAGPKTKRLKDEETEGPQKQADDCELAPDDSAAQRGTVFFYGFRQIEENPVFYALAEAFVLPSLKEEWGLVVNEAMAAGLPVIVSRTAGCAEDLLPRSEQVTSDGWRVTGKNADDSLEERSNGFVFDPKSSDALSEALRRIADQETKRPKDGQTDGLTEMGRRSREIVAKFSCENFARQATLAARAASKK